MSGKIKLLITTLILLLSVLSASLFAQSGRVTGKLEGVIVDGDTGEPLVGVNIVLANTLLGATTDADGYYIILNIPAGTYDVEYTYVGYASKLVKGAVISPDQRTKINMKLQVEAVQGEVVEVVAERPIIQRDQTGNVVEISSDQIKRKPVTTFTGIIQNQAGAVTTNAGQSGGIHIRGGRSNELVYYIDGVNTNDPASSGRGTTVDINAIEQLKIVTGGFNAEYGEAMSGVVQIVTKSGPKDNYVFYGESQSNDILNGSQYDNGYNKSVFNFGGPVPFMKKRVTFFVNGALEQVKVDNPSGFANIWHDDRRAPGFTFKLTADPTKNFRLFISGNYNKSTWNQYDHVRSKGFWLNYGPERGRESYLLSASLTHTISKKFFYDLTFSHFSTAFHLYGQAGKNYNEFQSVNTMLPWVSEANLNPNRLDPYFDEENYQWRNGMTEEQAWMDYYHNLKYWSYDENGNIQWISLDRKIDAYNNRYLDTGYYTYNADSTDIVYVPFSKENYNLFLKDREEFKQFAYQGDIQYARYPADKFGYFNYGYLPWWHERSTKKYEAEGAFQGQLNKYNYIKIGGKVNFSRLDYTDIQLLNVNPYFDAYLKKPTVAAGYIQDKIEYEDMIINVGLRYDYFHPHSEVLKDLNDVEAGYKQATLKQKWSPRFGIAFAVSDKTLMRANYGHFFQVPELGEIYQSIQADFTSGIPLIGNPDLPPQQETMYAVALKHRLSNSVSVEVNGYYKDIQKLLSTRQETTQWQGRPAQYTIFKISDFAKVKGVDITLEKRPSKFFYGSLTYSYMDAKGSGSSSREFYYRYGGDQLGELPRKEYPLEFDITHSIKLDVSLFLPPKWGPSLFGFKPLQDLNTNFFFVFNSGPPYTPENLKGEPGELGSKRMPSTNRVDLRVEKYIPFGDRFRMSLFADVRNLFNTENIENLWVATGLPNDNGYRPPFESSIYAAEAAKWGYPSAEAFYADKLATWQDYVNRPNYYGIPRIIRFGVSAQVSL